MARDGVKAGISPPSGLWSQIHRQRGNLTLITYLLKKYADQLQIIDAVAYRRLTLLIQGKGGALAIVEHEIHSNAFPVVLPYEDFLEALDRADADITDPRNEAKLYGQLHPMVTQVPLSERWTANMLPELKAIIEQSQPRKQLEEIQEQLLLLGQALKDTFTVAEILPVVGEMGIDRRLSWS